MDSPKEAPKPPKLVQSVPEPAKREPAQPQAEPSQPELARPVPPFLATQTTHNAIKLIAEAILPGASLLMDGKIVQGGLHLLAGAVARVALGPIGYVAVIANSYSTSTTGKNLLEQFSRFAPAKAE